MTEMEIARDLTLALIEKHGITAFGACDDKDQVQVAETNAKAVAAAYEVIFAGLINTLKKSR